MIDTEAQPPGVLWARVDAAFFVASSRGTFLGSVDGQFENEFIARDAHSCLIGRYAELKAGMIAVIDHSTKAAPA